MNEAIQYLQTEVAGMSNPEYLDDALTVLSDPAASENAKKNACDVWVNSWNNGLVVNDEQLTYNALVVICDTVDPNRPYPNVRL